MSDALFLTSFALAEPEDKFYRYFPGWLNVWESHLYKKALINSAANGWVFKRFGTSQDIYVREMIRKPHYMAYIKAMEDVADIALQNMLPKERMHLLKSRTAFIYVDAWGESALFESISSALHTFFIDTLPKNILKKFAINDLTCKIRGEKQSFMQALRVAADYIYWGVFDFVVICAAYRAIPCLVFSDIPSVRKQQLNINMAVERVGCFIFSGRESPVKIKCGNYIVSGSNANARGASLFTPENINVLTCAWIEKEKYVNSLASNKHVIDLVAYYGHSGCMMPALGWEYIKQQRLSSGLMRTVVGDAFGGYNFFDSEY